MDELTTTIETALGLEAAELWRAGKYREAADAVARAVRALGARTDGTILPGQIWVAGNEAIPVEVVADYNGLIVYSVLFNGLSEPQYGALRSDVFRHDFYLDTKHA